MTVFVSRMNSLKRLSETWFILEFCPAASIRWVKVFSRLKPRKILDGEVSASCPLAVIKTSKLGNSSDSRIFDSDSSGSFWVYSS